MVASVSEIISIGANILWQAALCDKKDPAFVASVKDIYERCNAVEKSERELLSHPSCAVLKGRLNGITSSIGSLWFEIWRDKIKGGSDASNGSLSKRSRQKVCELVRCLHQGDDSQTRDIVLQMPTSFRTSLFQSLARILECSEKEAEQAFLNTPPYAAFVPDKLRAVLRSVDNPFSLELGALCGNLSHLQLLLSENIQIDEHMLGNAVKRAFENDHFDCVRYLLSQGRKISQHDVGALQVIKH